MNFRAEPDGKPEEPNDCLGKSIVDLCKQQDECRIKFYRRLKLNARRLVRYCFCLMVMHVSSADVERAFSAFKVAVPDSCVHAYPDYAKVAVFARQNGCGVAM
eukprot:scaffold2097_cov147-Pinguiococcus_pyrenoidosus.AAC.2